jgi:hypothetical protein
MLRRLVDRLTGRSTDDQPAAAPAPRDYAQEREDRSNAQLSDEDRAWGEASRERDRENRARDQTAPGNT